MPVDRPCPICRKAARPRPENTFFPFCGERCKLVDLGNWLNESYRIDAGQPGEEELPNLEDET